MKKNREQTLSELIPEELHSELLLGAARRLPLNRGVENTVREVGLFLKRKIESTPDYSETSLYELTPKQISDMQSRANALARIENTFKEFGL